jgi:hypothetical protein
VCLGLINDSVIVQVAIDLTWLISGLVMTTAGYEAFSLTSSAVFCGYRNLPERLMSYEVSFDVL